MSTEPKSEPKCRTCSDTGVIHHASAGDLPCGCEATDPRYETAGAFLRSSQAKHILRLYTPASDRQIDDVLESLARWVDRVVPRRG